MHIPNYPLVLSITETKGSLRILRKSISTFKSPKTPRRLLKVPIKFWYGFVSSIYPYCSWKNFRAKFRLQAFPNQIWSGARIEKSLSFCSQYFDRSYYKNSWCCQGVIVNSIPPLLVFLLFMIFLAIYSFLLRSSLIADKAWFKLAPKRSRIHNWIHSYTLIQPLNAFQFFCFFTLFGRERPVRGTIWLNYFIHSSSGTEIYSILSWFNPGCFDNTSPTASFLVTLNWPFSSTIDTFWVYFNLSSLFFLNNSLRSPRIAPYLHDTKPPVIFSPAVAFKVTVATALPTVSIFAWILRALIWKISRPIAERADFCGLRNTVLIFLMIR